MTLSHTLAHKFALPEPNDAAFNKTTNTENWSLDIPRKVIDSASNQLHLNKLIHAWFEEQVNFQLGFIVLKTDFDPERYVSQFITNFCIDHKFYLEVLDEEVKQYIIECAHWEDAKRKKSIQGKYKYQYYDKDFGPKF